MRFTPDILRKHAQVLVDKETKSDRSIVAAYLQGSLLYGSPLMGGVGDIDLVFIHSSPPDQANEIRPLTPEIHFDIEHHDQMQYRRPRDLRVDPRLGPAIRDAQPLYDPRHFFDFTQAGVRSNYDYPENMHARAKPLLEGSRQFWLDRQISPVQEITTELPTFLDALQNAINAVSLLSGPPLPTRRLGVMFPDRAASAGVPGLSIAFSHLLGAVTVSKETINAWLASWQDAMTIVQKESESFPILAQKKTYYQTAIETILDSARPADSIWPIIVTWTEAVTNLPNHPHLHLPWIKALTILGFAGKDYQNRLAAFDSFLETCETLILGEQEGTDVGAF